MFLLGVTCRVMLEERGVPQITALEVGVKCDYEGMDCIEGVIQHKACQIPSLGGIGHGGRLRQDAARSHREAAMVGKGNSGKQVWGRCGLLPMAIPTNISLGNFGTKFSLRKHYALPQIKCKILLYNWPSKHTMKFYKILGRSLRKSTWLLGKREHTQENVKLPK
jgi:hypothetical protein